MIVLCPVIHPKIRPEDLLLFQQLVAVAKCRQPRTLTRGEYEMLERAFLRANEPPTSPLFGWFYAVRERLRSALCAENIAVARPHPPVMHDFMLTKSGMKRLKELEGITKRSASVNRVA
jgi:hypothetical protein